MFALKGLIIKFSNLTKRLGFINVALLQSLKKLYNRFFFFRNSKRAKMIYLGIFKKMSPPNLFHVLVR